MILISYGGNDSDNPMLDVTLAIFDGTGICEFVGLYILGKLSLVLAKQCRIKAESFSVTIEINMIDTDFLHVIFMLYTGKNFRFCKLSIDLLYINIQSNHPNTIRKELHRMIDKKILELSCKKYKFNKAKGIYEKKLN